MKKWYESKTMWFNIVAVGVAIAGPVLAGQGYTGEVAPEVSVFVLAAVAGINAALRYFATSTSLR